MRRALLRIALLAGTLVFTTGQAGAAGSTHHLAGGGTASISQFAMNVTIEGSSGPASGSFECLMAGRSGFVLGGVGLAHNMIVHATPTSGTVAGSVATFKGAATLILDGRQKMDVHVEVRADVAAQTLQLTVVELGTAGVLPTETIQSGQISLT